MEKENTSFLDKVAFIDTKLDEVLKSAFKTEKKYKTRLRNIESQYSASAINLMDYLAFRSFDIDKLQKKMHFSGLDDGNQGKSEMFGEYERTFEKMRG